MSMTLRSHLSRLTSSPPCDKHFLLNGNGAASSLSLAQPLFTLSRLRKTISSLTSTTCTTCSRCLQNRATGHRSLTTTHGSGWRSLHVQPSPSATLKAPPCWPSGQSPPLAACPVSASSYPCSPTTPSLHLCIPAPGRASLSPTPLFPAHLARGPLEILTTRQSAALHRLLRTNPYGTVASNRVSPPRFPFQSLQAS